MCWLRIIAAPIALIYAVVVHIRNLLYDIGFFKSKTFKTPTISVGNLSLGGTGKTPMIDFLLTHLKDEKKIAVLSRGYRRKSKGFQLANTNSTVEILGDEPYQLYQKHSDVTLAVDGNRVNGIERLEEIEDFDLILLDDAFQHRKVKPSLSILLTTFQKPYPKDFYFPSGSLRDGKNQAKRADIIVVTKCPTTVTQEDIQLLANRIAPLQNQELLFASLKYDDKFFNGKEHIAFENLKDKRVALVTGIANPKPLVAHLKSKKLHFEHLKFNDHYFFSDKDIAEFSRYEFVLTTEKDFTRLEGKLDNLYYLRISHHFFNDGKEVVLDKITELVRPD